jgi:hypothetical protein
MFGLLTKSLDRRFPLFCLLSLLVSICGGCCLKHEQIKPGWKKVDVEAFLGKPDLELNDGTYITLYYRCFRKVSLLVYIDRTGTVVRVLRR